MDIICAGEMLIDFTPMQQQGTYKANPGGAPVVLPDTVPDQDLPEGNVREIHQK